MPRFVIRSLGHHDLPPELSEASDDDVEDVLRRAAAFLGRPHVDVERVASVIGCMPVIDVVASVEGVPILVAQPAM